MSILKSTNSGIDTKLTEKFLFDNGFKVECTQQVYHSGMNQMCEAITYKNWNLNFYIMRYDINGGVFVCWEYYNQRLTVENIRQLVMLLKFKKCNVVTGFNPDEFCNARNAIRKEYNIKI
jgi:hypothetical protein